MKRVRFCAGSAVIVAALLASSMAPARAATISHTAVIFSRHFNVFVTNTAGKSVTAITSRGTGYQGIYYPWYQWSPDGRYILLVRSEPATGNRRQEDLLLLDARGKILRTLATMPAYTDFYPHWAIDGDQIAYVAWTKWPKTSTIPYYAINGVGIDGKKHVVWGYWSIGVGCGGGTSDPAETAFWGETGFGGMPSSLQWSLARHLAIYSAGCDGGLKLTDTRTGATRVLGTQRNSWNEAAISRAGTLAVTGGTCGSKTCTPNILLVNLTSGAIVRTIPGGELPSWSPDGRTLYFERRRPSRTRITMVDVTGNTVTFQPNITSLWSAHADGASEKQLLAEDAFGFGRPAVTGDGRSIIFSRVDNDWRLWNHRLTGNRFSPALIRQYGPSVSIQRFDSSGGLVTIATHAGLPSVQP